MPDIFYHGTLRRHSGSIQERGLIPSIGEFTRQIYGENADGLLPAVFLATDEGLERVVHAMVAAAMNEVTGEDEDEYDIGPHYHLNDELFFRYVALAIVDTEKHFQLADDDVGNSSQPLQAEEGDWFSLVSVKPKAMLVGDDLREFLETKGLMPSTINAFVDPKSIKQAPFPSI